MSNETVFFSTGKQKGTIDVRLSYKIIHLFSEGLYTSPNKAIEELVANSFDAGARHVHVLLSPNLHSQDATIVIIDNGNGMDDEDLKQHWLIGTSNKRELNKLPMGRQQIGKFGIGKLATYVLAERLTHISKQNGKYYSTSMDFTSIDKRMDKEVEPKSPIRIPLRELTEAEAKQAVKTWTDTKAFKNADLILFGKGSSPSWTIAVMSSLKEKVHEISEGTLGWILRTALPLRPDFSIWLNGTKLIPSKQAKGLLKKWILGKDLIELSKPSPKDVVAFEDKSSDIKSENRFGFDVPGLGRIWGYAETYKDLLTGKSDEIGRSHGFFVYVYGRLLNVIDGHFGISPDELRHGTFGRIRVVAHMDGLDRELRSSRETISEGPLFEIAKNILRSIFNAIRLSIEKHDADEEPGAKLSRKLASSPSGLSRRPIIELTRAVLEGKFISQYLIVPEKKSEKERETFISSLEQRATEAQDFLAGLTIDYEGSPEKGIARYDTSTGYLRINAWHPFVATFYDDFTKGSTQPLEIFSMAEVLAEAHLHAIGVKQAQIHDYLSMRDQLLRNLANESGRESALSIANNLRDARNNPNKLEEKIHDAFRSLGFEVTPLPKKGNPDGVATANLSAKNGAVRRYTVSLEAKSKEKCGTKVSAKSVGISTVARQRDKYKCDHAIVIGPAFPTKQGEQSSLAQEIQDDRRKSAAENNPKTITLITIDDLAKLVRLRPMKQVGLVKIRELFMNCSLPEESSKWIDSIHKIKIKRPPYKQIIDTIEKLQKQFENSRVEYGALRVKLSDLTPPIKYDPDEDLKELCKAMAQMTSGAMFANDEIVELDQSAINVIDEINKAMKDYPMEEQ